MKNKLNSKTAFAKTSFIEASRRLLTSVSDSMNVLVKNNTTLKIERQVPQNKLNAKPYGIIPFALTASRTEIANMVEQLQMAKYLYMDRGDFYNSWLADQRERILLGVLSGMITFKINKF